MPGMNPSPLAPAVRRSLRRGIAALQRGDAEGTERLLATVVAAAPQCADAWHYRAIAAHQRGRDDDAGEWFHRASELDPERPDFALNQARFLLERGDPEAALAAADRAARAPKQAEDATLLLAVALAALGRGREAIQRLQEFLGSHPGARRVRMQLIALLSEHGENAAVLDTLGGALDFAANDPVFGPLTVAALHGEKRHEEADELCRRLIATPESPAAAWLELAFASLQRGATDEAVTQAHETLRRDSTFGGAWLLLAEAGEVAPERLPAPLPPPGDAIMEFARARILDRRGDPAAAWNAYVHANATAVAEDGEYNPEQQNTYVDGLIRHLDTAFVHRAARLGRPGKNPVFICGVSRSGTTLLEQVLAAHPAGAIRPGGEMKTIHHLLRRRLGPQGIAATGQRLAALGDAELGAMIAAWARAIEEETADAEYLIDKMPSNVFLLGLLHVAFPEAPIVLLERDPVAIACSCFVTPFGEGHKFSHRLEDIQHFFAQFRRMVTHWDAVLPPGRVLCLGYEELVADPRRSLGSLLDTLDLAWDERMLEFYHRRDPIATASLLQVRKPLDPRAAAGWKRFESQLAPWRERLEAAYYNGKFSPPLPP